MRFMSSPTSVDLPEPDGAEMMKTVVVPVARFKVAGLFKVKRLLPDFFDRGLRGQRQFGDPEADFTRAGGFGQDGIGLAVHLLQQKIQLLSAFAAGLEQDC